MTPLKSSYTSANALPLKLLRNRRLIDHVLTAGKIPPIHPQFIPTNRCNMACPFCSCADEDKELEMSWEQAERAVANLAFLGAAAVTITGGGEPLLYPHIGRLVDEFAIYQISVGLVSNGLMLNPDLSWLSQLRWCRISNGDHRTMSDIYARRLAETVVAHPGVDWAFSHVVSNKPNLAEIERVVEFANEHRFTHVRLVSDLTDVRVSHMDAVRNWLEGVGVDLSRVIFQDRAQYTKGTPCYIGFLKPVIAADGQVYACCGAQYALDESERRFPEKLSLGSVDDLVGIYARSNAPLNGRICDRCYYSEYNASLEALLHEPAHGEFL